MPQFFHSANRFSLDLFLRQTVLTYHSSVPTQNQVLVPETLLKKRKSQEAARAESRAAAEATKKVSDSSLRLISAPQTTPFSNFYDA